MYHFLTAVKCSSCKKRKCHVPAPATMYWRHFCPASMVYLRSVWSTGWYRQVCAALSSSCSPAAIRLSADREKRSDKRHRWRKTRENPAPIRNVNSCFWRALCKRHFDSRGKLLSFLLRFGVTPFKADWSRISTEKRKTFILFTVIMFNLWYSF